MARSLPKPIVDTASVASGEPSGNVHRVNEHQGWYAAVRVMVDLRQTLNVSDDVVVTLRERRNDLELHSRTVTLPQNHYVTLELFGILNRIERAADLRIELRTTAGGDYTSIALFDYKLVVERHPQQGGHNE